MRILFLAFFLASKILEDHNSHLRARNWLNFFY